MNTPIAVLASGRGSNFGAIQSAIAAGLLEARVVAVVSDQPEAEVLQKASAAGIPQVVIPFPGKGAPLEQRRRQHEEDVLAALADYSPRFLVMAGYMRIVTPRLIDAFRADRGGYSRIVNVHPSLLPAFPGVAGYRQAFEYGVKVTGVTVHLVDHDLDSGPICAQEAFEIGDCRSAEEVERKGMAVEHRLYPKTLQWILKEKFIVEERNGRSSVRAN